MGAGGDDPFPWLPAAVIAAFFVAAILLIVLL